MYLKCIPISGSMRMHKLLIVTIVKNMLSMLNQATLLNLIICYRIEKSYFLQHTVIAGDSQLKINSFGKWLDSNGL